MSKCYYLTTTSPYVNSDPHVGFALEIIQADALARFHTLLGDEVFLIPVQTSTGRKFTKKPWNLKWTLKLIVICTRPSLGI